MYPLPLQQYGTYPIEVLGTSVLVVSLLITLAWLIYLYR